MARVEPKARGAPVGGLAAIGSTLAYLREPKRFLEGRLKRQGPITRFGLLGMDAYAIAEPAVVDAILRGQAKAFDKGWRDVRLRRTPKPYRAVVQPAFHANRMAGYAPCIGETTEETAERWTSGAPLDVLTEMTALGLQVFARALLGAPVPTDTHELAGAVASVNAYLADPLHLTRWGRRLPTPARDRFRAGVRVIDGALLQMIAERRAAPADGGDLLSALVRAGAAQSDLEIRGQLIKPFTAGPDTTALLLTYALHLIASHPEVEARLVAEVASLGAGDLTAEDLGRAPYLGATLREVMRLYPSLWVIGRGALEDCVVADLELKRGAQAHLCIAYLHRDPRWFPDPDRFDPDRWRAGLAGRLPRGVYLPLGDGPHICLGNHFAVLQASLVLATLLRRWRFTPIDPRPLEVIGSTTLRPARPVRLTPELRARVH